MKPNQPIGGERWNKVNQGKTAIVSVIVAAGAAVAALAPKTARDVTVAKR